ncbi:phage holin family protein [Streptomyces sp. ME19-01-6]|uniref:phage holin family protein n=1 Tax=Streptomyces sp. ME19-01-6 TaxID=3028686 RepID=UPI0029BB4B6D|nr:phage holin family protein [Streptomyces sp. ME19-01-6]MDX3228804.1 phage holin family protein [Streptomyces sp. ME19-01-6]
MTDKPNYSGAGDRIPGPSTGDLSEPMARAIREQVREELQVVRDELGAELREQSRRRTVRLYGGAAAAALYGGGALAACLVLLFGLAMPVWIAALIVGVLLMLVAAALKNSAGEHHGAAHHGRRPHFPRPHHGAR